MSKTSPQTSYCSIVTLAPITGALATEQLFVPQSQLARLSPLDEFIDNTNAVNLLAPTGPNTPFPKGLGSLLLLGYMSAVEGYVRRLVVSLIAVDDVCREAAAPELIPLGVTFWSTDPDQLADALLESFSFAGREGIERAFKLLSIPNAKQKLGKQLDAYHAICHLRHCCVHRFGRLGAKNAIALGQSAHGSKIGQTFSIDRSGFEDIAVRLRDFVKGVNNLVWESVLVRTVANKPKEDGTRPYSADWKWHWQRDKRRFTSYWDVFATTKDSVVSPTAQTMYNHFRKHHNPRPSGRAS